MLAILLLGCLTHFQAKRVLLRHLAQELRTQSVTAAEVVEHHPGGVRHDLLSLARFLQRRLKPQMTEPQWQSVEQEFLETLRTEQAYYQVRFISPTGHEILRVNNAGNDFKLVEKQNLQFKGDRYYVREAMLLAPGEIYLSHLDFKIEQGEIESPGRLVARMATPVADQKGGLLGLVVINVFGEEILKSIRQLTTSAGDRALLLNQNFSFIDMQTQGDRFHFRSADQHGLHRLIPELLIDPPPAEPTTFFGRDQLFAVAPINAGIGRRWYLVKVYPEALLSEELQQLRQGYLWTVVPHPGGEYPFQ